MRVSLAFSQEKEEFLKDGNHYTADEIEENALSIKQPTKKKLQTKNETRRRKAANLSSEPGFSRQIFQKPV